MPLRPIDAIFVHPKRRLYVVYYRGVLWQLPRMSINNAAWQRRQPYTDSPSELHLSHCQLIHDAVLAKKLYTLNLPTSLHGSTLLQFESWWDTNGFSWIKDQPTPSQSPLNADGNGDSAVIEADDLNHNTMHKISAPQTNKSPTNDKETETIDIFTGMLADLADEVRQSNT
ncbi:hypothetical protein [Psychrobacter urativorans]|uniref:Uncharacterized protein n=1 Tax=Psychrobacter urativorans TaxID=45610 RepID=A0A0M4U590_9GAMM|nr:hypothetical protein [Psychrobacter urativorans]ALF58814.1 hypothetical protein AOC03_01070 [Psychrobacter urativorans]